MTKHKRGKPPIENIDNRLFGIFFYITDMQSSSPRSQITKVNKKQSQQAKLWESPRFYDKKLREMYETGKGSHKFSEAVVENYYEKMQILQMVSNKQDLYNFKSLGFHKLKEGKRKGQYAIWLTGNWRLIVKIEEDEFSEYLLIVEIVDYHN